MSTVEGGGNIISNGLVLYYDAANPKSYLGVGIIWNDLILKYNGGLYNGPTFDSNNNGSIVFDGVNDYVKHDNLDLGTICTWSVWINYYTGFSPLYVVLGSNSPNRYTLYYDGSYFGLNYGNGNYGVLYYPSLVANTWYNITCSRNGTTTKYYVNGSYIGNIVSSGTDTSKFWIIGAERVGFYYSKVKISTVALYNRDLLDDEVLYNYKTLKSRYEL